MNNNPYVKGLGEFNLLCVHVLVFLVCVRAQSDRPRKREKSCAEIKRSAVLDQEKSGGWGLAWVPI